MNLDTFIEWCCARRRLEAAFEGRESGWWKLSWVESSRDKAGWEVELEDGAVKVGLRSWTPDSAVTAALRKFARLEAGRSHQGATH